MWLLLKVKICRDSQAVLYKTSQMLILQILIHYCWRKWYDLGCSVSEDAGCEISPVVYCLESLKQLVSGMVQKTTANPQIYTAKHNEKKIKNLNLYPILLIKFKIVDDIFQIYILFLMNYPLNIKNWWYIKTTWIFIYLFHNTFAKHI